VCNRNGNRKVQAAHVCLSTWSFGLGKSYFPQPFLPPHTLGVRKPDNDPLCLGVHFGSKLFTFLNVPSSTSTVTGCMLYAMLYETYLTDLVTILVSHYPATLPIALPPRTFCHPHTNTHKHTHTHTRINVHTDSEDTERWCIGWA